MSSQNTPIPRRSIICYFSVVVPILFFLVTGLIPEWGRWYSSNLAYRRQTDALLSGHLALSSSPCEIGFDMAWSEGGVQQVWGLGVPAWRALFELSARLTRHDSFPDRLCIAVAMIIWAFVCLSSLWPSSTGHASASQLKGHPLAQVFGVGILAFFPPIVGMCSGLFEVYEEPTLYGYFYCTALFAVLLRFRHKRTTPGYYVVTAFCGVAGFIRPTLEIYGLASFLIISMVQYGEQRSVRDLLNGSGLFLLGGGLLLASNYQRFGAPLEFGHKLNLTLPELMYASRFGYPFEHERFWPALGELFGAMFFVAAPAQNTAAQNIFPFQSETMRWRYFGTNGFDVSYLVALFVAVFCVARVRRLRRDAKGLSEAAVELLWIMVWALLCAAPLAWFYLRFHVLGGRYLLDFAPAFAGFMVGFWRFLAIWIELRSRIFFTGCAYALALGWMSWELWCLKFAPPGDHQVQSRDEPIRAWSKPAECLVPLPREYVRALAAEATGIPQNGCGWDPQTGVTEPVVVLFGENISQLKLEVEPAAGEAYAHPNYSQIRVRVALEELVLVSSWETLSGRILVFQGPRQVRYRRGVQAVFIAFAPPERMRDSSSGFVLRRISLDSTP
jgi:hypothetical protein